MEALAWTFAVPALQGADEGAHVAYVQKVADAREIPWPQRFTLGRDDPAGVSSEQRAAWTWAGLEPLRGNLAARPLWTEEDERLFAAAAAGASREDGGVSSAFKNPPLYYVVAAVPYTIAGGSFFDRVFAMRLAQIPLLLAVVWLTWLLAGEVFGRRRSAQTLAAGVVALHPVLLDTSTRVTPDTLLVALSAGVLYLAARLVREGPRPVLLAGTVALLVAAGLTQGRGLGLVLPAALAVAVGALRGRRSPWRLVGLGAGSALALLVASFFYVSKGDPTYNSVGYLSYLSSFYLPAVLGQVPTAVSSWDVRDVYIDRFLATFVQFEVAFSPGVRRLLVVAAVAGTALLVAALVRHRRAVRARAGLAVVLVASFVLPMLAIHAAAFRSLAFVDSTDPVITGRYLLPFLPLFGVAVALGVRALPRRVGAALGGAVLGSMALLQIAALGLVVERFYA